MCFVLLKGFVLFFLCSIIFGQANIIFTIDFHIWVIVILICTLTTFTFYCIGAIFGGLALYFKRISSILNIVDYLLLFFTGILNDMSNINPISRSILEVLPITQANSLINSVFNSQIQFSNVLWFVANCTCFIILSYFLLVLLIKVAKNNGKLGQY